MKKRTPAERERSKQIRADRMKMCGYICEWCKEKPATEEHHVFGRKSEYIETVRGWCSECHRGSGCQERINITKVEASAELIERYGVDEARKKAGGRLYFKKNI